MFLQYSPECSVHYFYRVTFVVLQNVSPAHLPDIIIYIDAITIVFEEASKDGLPSSLPIACIEAGNEHSLPNLALRLLSTQNILYSLNFS